MEGWSLQVLETVDVETPASCATSFNVTAMRKPPVAVVIGNVYAPLDLELVLFLFYNLLRRMSNVIALKLRLALICNEKNSAKIKCKSEIIV